MSNLRFKVGDRAKVVDRKYGHEFEIGEEVEIKRVCDDSDPHHYRCHSIDLKRYWYLTDSELAPIESFEEKTAKAFEEIANGTGPEMVVISAEEYANFQKMEKMLTTIYYTHHIDSVEIEKLLKQKYNP